MYSVDCTFGQMDVDCADCAVIAHFIISLYSYYFLLFAEAANKAILRFENAILDGKSKHALPISGNLGL